MYVLGSATVYGGAMAVKSILTQSLFPYATVGRLCLVG